MKRVGVKQAIVPKVIRQLMPATAATPIAEYAWFLEYHFWAEWFHRRSGDK